MALRELPIGLRLGSYELLARIGEGGMGAVYAAVHVGLGKRVAIKVLRSELSGDSDVRARFMREGKAAVAVRHPNVVDIDDVGVHEDMPYLVMELLEGENLHALIARRERLSVQETADIVVPILSAMAESHRAGVVHRDLKPDNIFLARGAGGLPVPKVLDFGISKLREAQSLGLTGDNALLGTPYFMAPEQASSARDVDERSDLYAIGIILYHAVTGRVPFTGASLTQVIGQILHATPRPLRDSVPNIPAAFEAIVLRLIEKDPARRYQDAQSLGQALLPYASERIRLTYSSEFSAAAISANTVAAAETLVTASTLSPNARSATTTQSNPKARAVTWATVIALALVGAALTYWPRSAQQPSSSVSPASVPVPAITADPTADPTLPPSAAIAQPSSGELQPVAAPIAPKGPASESNPNSEQLKPVAAPIAPKALATESSPSSEAEKAPPSEQPTRRAKLKSQRPKPTTKLAPNPAPSKPSAEEDIWGNRK